MKTPLSPSYRAPVVRIVPLRIERGFVVSLENPEIDNEIEW